MRRVCRREARGPAFMGAIGPEPDRAGNGDGRLFSAPGLRPALQREAK